MKVYIIVIKFIEYMINILQYVLIFTLGLNLSYLILIIMVNVLGFLKINIKDFDIICTTSVLYFD